MANIGLITEGITDQIVITEILNSYCDDPDLLVNPLEPLFDETDRNR